MTSEQQFSRALVSLFKHAVYQEKDTALWNVIIMKKFKIKDYLNKMGLTLIIDESDGYAYLKQWEETEGIEDIPKLIPRRTLTYPVSLLLMILRRRLQEFDVSTGDKRLILSGKQIAELMKVYLQDTTNEAKLAENISKYIDTVEKMGFLRGLNEDNFEVQRIIRSFVNAEFLSQFKEDLSDYTQYLNPNEE